MSQMHTLEGDFNSEGACMCGAGSIQEISPPLGVTVNLKILQKIVLKEEKKGVT